MTPGDRYAKVRLGYIWRKPWSADVKNVAAYLVTCERRTTEGLFWLPLEYAIKDVGWPAKRFKAAFHELQRVGFVAYDQECEVCLLPDALEVQAPVNDNQAKGAARAVREIPACALRERWVSLVERLSERLTKALHQELPEWFVEPFSEPFAKPLPEPFSEPFDEPGGGSFTNPPSPTPSQRLRGVA